MSYSAFVQSKFLKTVATVSSFVFVSLLLLNPGIYSDMVKKETNVSANFLANEYSTTEDEYVIDSSLGDLEYIDAIQDAPSSGSLQSYVVQSRDTLSDISKKYQISVDQLKNLNNIIDESSVRPGSVVYISSQPWFVYPVRERTSLMVFANMYNVNKEDLMRVNNETDDMAPYEEWDIILVPNKTLNQAYDLWLLQKPEPKKIIVASRPSSSNRITSSRKNTSTTISNIKQYSNSKIVSSWRQSISDVNGMGNNYCTDYAAHKARFAFPIISGNKVFRSFWWNAKHWYSNAKAAWFKVSSKPSVGAIAVFSNGWNGNSAGHVAIVESIDNENNKIKVSDMNYKGRWVVTVRWIDMNDSMTQVLGWKQKLTGFIPVQKLPSKLQKQYDALKS